MVALLENEPVRPPVMPVSDASLSLVPGNAKEGRIWSVKAYLEARYGVLENSYIESYINGLLSRLHSSSSSQSCPFHAKVLNSKEANAMVLEDGSVFVTAGLLELCETEDELASALGHEEGHFMEGHFYGRYGAVETGGANWLNEREADIIGMSRIVNNAGYNPTAFINLMKRLDERQRGAADISDERLITSPIHEGSIERVSDILLLAYTFDMENSGKSLTPIQPDMRGKFISVANAAPETRAYTREDLDDAIAQMTGARSSWLRLHLVLDGYIRTVHRSNKTPLPPQGTAGYAEALEQYALMERGKYAEIAGAHDSVLEGCKRFLEKRCGDKLLMPVLMALVTHEFTYIDAYQLQDENCFQGLEPEEARYYLAEALSTLEELEFVSRQQGRANFPLTISMLHYHLKRCLDSELPTRDALRNAGKELLDDTLWASERGLLFMEKSGCAQPECVRHALHFGLPLASINKGKRAILSSIDAAVGRYDRLLDIFEALESPEECMLFYEALEHLSAYSPGEVGVNFDIYNPKLEVMKKGAATKFSEREIAKILGSLGRSNDRIRSVLRDKFTKWGFSTEEAVFIERLMQPKLLEDPILGPPESGIASVDLSKVKEFFSDCARRVDDYLTLIPETLYGLAGRERIDFACEAMDILCAADKTADVMTTAQRFIIEALHADISMEEKFYALEKLSHFLPRMTSIGWQHVSCLLDTAFKEHEGPIARLAVLERLMRLIPVHPPDTDASCSPHLALGLRELLTACEDPRSLFIIAHFLPASGTTNRLKKQSLERMLEPLSFDDALHVCQNEYPALAAMEREWSAYLSENKCGSREEFSRIWEISKRAARLHAKGIGAAVFGGWLASFYSCKDMSRTRVVPSFAELLNVSLTSSLDEQPLLEVLSDYWVANTCFHLSPKSHHEEMLERRGVPVEAYTEIAREQIRKEREARAAHAEEQYRNTESLGEWRSSLYALPFGDKALLLRKLLIDPASGVLLNKESSRDICGLFVDRFITDSPESKAKVKKVLFTAIDTLEPDELFSYVFYPFMEHFLRPPEKPGDGALAVGNAITRNYNFVLEHSWDARGQKRPESHFAWIPGLREPLMRLSGFSEGDRPVYFTEEVFPDYCRKEEENGAELHDSISALVRGAETKDVATKRLLQTSGVVLPLAPETRDRFFEDGVYHDFESGRGRLYGWSVIEREIPEFFDHYRLGRKIGEGSSYIVFDVLDPQNNETGLVVRVLSPNALYTSRRTVDELDRVLGRLEEDEDPAIAKTAAESRKLLPLVMQWVSEDMLWLRGDELDEQFDVLDGFGPKEGFNMRVVIPKVHKVSDRPIKHVVIEEKVPGVPLSALLTRGDLDEDRLKEISALLTRAARKLADEKGLALSDFHPGNVVVGEGTIGLVDRNRPVVIPDAIRDLLSYRPSASDVVSAMLPAGRQRIAGRIMKQAVETIAAGCGLEGSDAEAVMRDTDNLVASSGGSPSPLLLFPILQSIAAKGGNVPLDAILFPKSLYWYQWLAQRAGFREGLIEAGMWKP